MHKRILHGFMLVAECGNWLCFLGVILLLMVQCKVMFTLEFRILTVGGWADL